MSRWAGFREQLRPDSALLRRALWSAIKHGPEPFVRYSPPAFGWAFGALLQERRRAVLGALRLVRGRRSRLEEARDVAEVFGNFACSLTDAMLVGAQRGFHATNRPVGDWHFLSCMARGGVIMATAQTAGWDVGGAFIHNFKPGREVWIVMEEEPNAAAREVQDESRRGGGVRIIHVGRDPLASLPILRHLRKGGVVALKYDRVYPGMRTRAVRFFGKPWRIPEGPLSLASLTGAPILPTFTRRLGFLEYELITRPPIYLPRRPTEAQLQQAADTMIGHLEGFVRAHPTQWMRFHQDGSE